MDDSIRALREADPRNNERAEGENDFGELRDRIVSRRVISLDEPRRPRFWRRMSLAGLAATAVTVAVLAGVLTVAAPNPGGRPAVQSAYAAVARAVAKTAEVGSSGTITTQLQVDPGRDGSGAGQREPRKPERDLMFTFRWNGDDFDLSGLRRMRYVGGEIYAYGDGRWERFGPVPADEEPGGVGDWVDAAKRTYNPKRVGELAKSLDDLEQKPQADGSTVYEGTTTLKVIGRTFADGFYPKTNSVVGMTVPDGIDGDAPVRVQLTIGADGVLKEWSGSYGAVDHELVFTARFSDLGSTPAIEAPANAVRGVRASK